MTGDDEAQRLVRAARKTKEKAGRVMIESIMLSGHRLVEVAVAVALLLALVQPTRG